MLGKAVQQRLVVCGWYRGQRTGTALAGPVQHEEESRDG